jgi:hypothetical protein
MSERVGWTASPARRWRWVTTAPGGTGDHPDRSSTEGHSGRSPRSRRRATRQQRPNLNVAVSATEVASDRASPSARPPRSVRDGTHLAASWATRCASRRAIDVDRVPTSGRRCRGGLGPGRGRVLRGRRRGGGVPRQRTSGRERSAARSRPTVVAGRPELRPVVPHPRADAGTAPPRRGRGGRRGSDGARLIPPHPR